MSRDAKEEAKARAFATGTSPEDLARRKAPRGKWHVPGGILAGAVALGLIGFTGYVGAQQPEVKQSGASSQQPAAKVTASPPAQQDRIYIEPPVPTAPTPPAVDATRDYQEELKRIRAEADEAVREYQAERRANNEAYLAQLEAIASAPSPEFPEGVPSAEEILGADADPLDADVRPVPESTPSGGWAKTCPGGSCYGEPSEANGRPRTQYVGGYYRSDGTYVGSHYRSTP